MKRIVLLLPLLAFVLVELLVPVQRSLAASHPSAGDELIRLEARWINAILKGDRNTVAAILSEHFKHITKEGTPSRSRAGTGQH